MTLNTKRLRYIQLASLQAVGDRSTIQPGLSAYEKGGHQVIEKAPIPFRSPYACYRACDKRRKTGGGKERKARTGVEPMDNYNPGALLGTKSTTSEFK